jgi:hypothetical protein
MSLLPLNSISVRMAQPSPSHRDCDREGHSHRSKHSTHRHHRTISSTTLLLVLSLILAVLAIMLSLPSQSSSSIPEDPATQGVRSMLMPIPFNWLCNPLPQLTHSACCSLMARWVTKCKPQRFCKISFADVYSKGPSPG